MRRLAAMVLLLLSCDTTGAYLYYANQYEPARDCLDHTTGLDVLAGTDPGASCSAKCIAGVGEDGGVVVYTSKMCGPPPIRADVSGTNPYCLGALAAAARSDFCDDAGGSSNPLDSGAADAAANDAGTE